MPPTVLHYDALAREVRTDTPKGFFTRVEYSPWAVARRVSCTETTAGSPAVS